ncbi:hypothetical protein E4U17_003482, partial [Claviceps sp. LM77 group G4]
MADRMPLRLQLAVPSSRGKTPGRPSLGPRASALEGARRKKNEMEKKERDKGHFKLRVVNVLDAKQQTNTSSSGSLDA